MRQVATAHKGKSARRCCLHGQAAHSSQPQLGVNAIEYTAELVSLLRQRGREWRQAEGDPGYTPLYSTVQVGTIKGGTAVNVVPDRCEFDFEVRPLPDTGDEHLPRQLENWAHQYLLPEMQKTSVATSIHLTERANYPGLKDDNSLDELKTLCSQALNMTTFASLAFGTEAGLFQQAGIPTVICGPGSISVAHKADEYIERTQLEQCVAFLLKIIQ